MLDTNFVVVILLVCLTLAYTQELPILIFSQNQGSVNSVTEVSDLFTTLGFFNDSYNTDADVDVTNGTPTVQAIRTTTANTTGTGSQQTDGSATLGTYINKVGQFATDANQQTFATSINIRAPTDNTSLGQTTTDTENTAISITAPLGDPRGSFSLGRFSTNSIRNGLTIMTSYGSLQSDSRANDTTKATETVSEIEGGSQAVVGGNGDTVTFADGTTSSTSGSLETSTLCDTKAGFGTQQLIGDPGSTTSGCIGQGSIVFDANLTAPFLP